MFEALVVLLLLLVAAYAVKLWMRVRQFPPGPHYSLLGDMLRDTAVETEKHVLGLKAKYGDVFSVFNMDSLAVYLNSYDIIKEAFVTHGDESSGRPRIMFPSPRIAKARGIVTAEGALWQEHRRFALTALRNFGLGRNRAQDIVLGELDFITTEFKSHAGKPFNPRLTLNRATTNVITRLVFGHRAGVDKEYDNLYNRLRDNLETASAFSQIILSFLTKYGPYLAIPGTPLHRGFKRTRENVEVLADYVYGKLEDHRKNFDPDRENEDLIDSYLSERYKMEKENPGVAHTFTDEQLTRIIFELFVAGTETTATTLRWGIFLLAHHPEVQERAQRELDELLQGRVPTQADKTRLNYTNAVMMEVMRFGSVTTFGGPPHRCLQDFKLNGYLIPEGAVIFANLFAVHRDESIWPDPFNFNPANFLDEQGHIRNENHLIPFNIGRRSCLGESLAKQEAFLLMCGFLQRFKLEKGPGFPDMNDYVFTNIIRAPKEFNVIASPRD